MIGALAIAAMAFIVSFFGLNLVEVQIHKLTKNKDKSYRIGVWVFAVLIAVYAFATSFGR